MGVSEVIYELRLRDFLSSGVNKANESVSGLHENLEKAKGMLETLGVGFAIFEGAKFIGESVKEFHDLNQAQVQLQNSMENMGTYTKASFDEAVKGAKELSEGISYSNTEVVKMQSQLALVGSIGPGQMQKVSMAAADVATKMGVSLEEAGNMLGKGINNPAMARRLGQTLKIDPGIIKHITDLATHGKEAEARMELIAAAESKVGGAAKAAFDADPMAQYNKAMEGLSLAVGEAGQSVLVALKPALMWLINGFKAVANAIEATIKWMKENKDIVEAVAIGVAAAAAAWAIYTVYVNAASYATYIMEAAQAALNFVMSVNPIALVVAAFAALVAIVVYCYEHFGTFHAILWGVWETMKAAFNWIAIVPIKVLYDLGMAVANVFNPSKMMAYLSDAKGQIFNGAKDLAGSFGKGYSEGMADFNKNNSVTTNMIEPSKAGVSKSAGLASESTAKQPKTKATGTKNVDIHITIGSLISGGFTVKTTNIKEGLAKVQDMVTQVLTGAVNDSQIIAGE